MGMLGSKTTISVSGSAVGRLKSISGLGFTRETIDMTDISEDMKNEIPARVRDGNEITIVAFFDDAAGVPSIVAATTNRTVVVTFPTTPAKTWTFSAVYTGFELGEVTLSKGVEVTMTFKISGEIAVA